MDPPLPIPNRTVKRDRANDSELPLAKVGHRQAPHNQTPVSSPANGGLCFYTPQSPPRSQRQDAQRCRSPGALSLLCRHGRHLNLEPPLSAERLRSDNNRICDQRSGFALPLNTPDSPQRLAPVLRLFQAFGGGGVPPCNVEGANALLPCASAPH